MSYESDPAGLGVGKRYGPLALGGVAGVTTGENGELRVVFEITAEELDASSSLSYTLPDSYALVDSVIVEVEEAFGAGDTLQVNLAGNALTAAVSAVDVLGMIKGALTATVANLVASSGDQVTVDTALIDSGSLVGSAKVIVELVRV